VKLGFSPIGALPKRLESISELKEMLRLGGWILPGVAISNVTAALPPLLLAAHGEGAVSAFGYAYRLHLSAIQLLVMAGSPVILARFSEMVAGGNWLALRQTVWKAGWLSAIIGAAAVLVVWIMGAQILQVVLGAGRFDAEASRRVAAHWGWLSLGLAPAIWGQVLAKNLQAESRPMVMSGLSGVGLLTLWASASILAVFMGEYATSAGLTVSCTIVTLIAWQAVRRSIARGQLATNERTRRRELEFRPGSL
jgi:peptidoglycan biosynthesis protein MviN/MurJ (putative lipid II flippase)